MKNRYFPRILAICTLLLLWAAPLAMAASKITLKSGKAAPSNIYVGKSYTLKVDGLKVKFSSSNKVVATVGQTTGKMSPREPGTVKITAKNAKNGKTVATKSFTVKQRATSVKADSEKLEMFVKGTATLQATKTPATSTDVIKFKSDNAQVATVGLSSGQVTAVGPGTAHITVYAMATRSTKLSSTANKTCTVEVVVQAAGDRMISVDNRNNVKFAVQFGTEVTAGDMKTVTVAHDGAAVGIKKIDVDGKKFTAAYVLDRPLGDGETYRFVYKTDTIDVRSKFIRCEKLTVEPTPLALSVGGKERLNAAIEPKDSTDFVRFKSDDAGIAKVDKDGTVTGVKPGETVVRVYATKKAATNLTNKKNVVAEVPVTVAEKDAIASAEQTGKKTVRLTFYCKAKDIAAATLSIDGAEVEAKAVVPFDAVKAVKNKPYALDLTLTENLTDGRRYTVTYTPIGAAAEPSQAAFTAMDVSVDHILILPQSVLAKVPTRVHAWAVTKAGTRLYGDRDGLTLSMPDKKSGATFEGGCLTIDEVGLTAEIFAELENGGGDSAEIACVEPDGQTLFCAALYPDHELGDGKSHLPGACHVLDHFACDGGDHGAARCGIAGHWGCDDLDHDAAQCGAANHWDCDGKDHGICSLCGYRLCNGKEHGVGECWTPPAQPAISYTILSGGDDFQTEPDFDHPLHSIPVSDSAGKNPEAESFPFTCFIRFNKLPDGADLSQYTITSSDPSILAVANAKQVYNESKNIVTVGIKGIKKGGAYLTVKDEKGTVIQNLSVIVGDASKVSGVRLYPSAVPLAQGGSGVKIRALLIDQYGRVLYLDDALYQLEVSQNAYADYFTVGWDAADQTSITVSLKENVPVDQYRLAFLFKFSYKSDPQSVKTYAQMLTVTVTAPDA